MYLHLGADTVVRTRDIVAVFDMDRATVNATSRKFLATAEKKKKVVNVSDDLPKSFVVCADGRVLISAVSSQTIARRNESNRCEKGGCRPASSPRRRRGVVCVVYLGGYTKVHHHFPASSTPKPNRRLPLSTPKKLLSPAHLHGIRRKPKAEP